MKRKILLYLSFALLLVALLSLSISAQEPVKSWDISASGSSVVAKLYNDTENSGNYSLVISGEGNMKNWAYNSFAPWYTLYSDKITSVTIEEGVTNVGNYAFWHFSTLKNIVIPKGVTKIGDSSFIDCSNLKKILLPESLISIGEYAFRNSGLGFAIIPDSVTTIGQYAFYESDMDYVIIGSGVEKIFGLSDYYTVIIALGIAGCISAMMKMPLTAIVFSIEALNCSSNILHVIIVVAVSYIITEVFGAKGINDSIIKNIIKTQEETLERKIIDTHVTIQKGSFAEERLSKDIIWPSNFFLLSISPSSTRKAYVDPHGHKTFHAGDILHIRYATFDEEYTKAQLTAIVGKQDDFQTEICSE